MTRREARKIAAKMYGSRIARLATMPLNGQTLREIRVLVFDSAASRELLETVGSGHTWEQAIAEAESDSTVAKAFGYGAGA